MFQLPGKVLKNLFQPPAVPLQSQKNSPPPIARPVAIAKPSQQAPKVQSAQDKAFGELPRRIRRIMNLAKEAGYTKVATIEGQHASGLWAQKFVKLYEQSTPGQKQILETRPMQEIFQFVNRLIDKGEL